ncbi:hypothetical protein EOL70_13400 [Leucothrix sargassi]|nr:hypothetical protein EOL70_13400 [Leucothrix sargassi]
MKKPYIYKLEADYAFRASFELDQLLVFKHNNKIWLVITPTRDIIVAKDYAWDGCSPKVSIAGFTLGIPDGEIHPETGKPRAYFASLIHDALLQFSDDPRMPFSRAQIDEMFYDILKRDGFKAAPLYYFVVRKLGGLYARFLSRHIE